jgi:multiple sugar transport system substrate-binding protein
MTTRRNFLAGAAATVATAALGACSGATTGSTSTATADDTSPVTLRFAWWGNDVRNKNTNQVISDYMKLHPNVTINGEPGVWASYWDKLSTQVAGNTAPDIVQMDEQYIRDYSKKGVLADLSKLPISTSKFASGLVDTGTISGKVTALCAGVNALSIVANPALFTKAGVDIPDDKTWTWDTAMQLSADLTTKLGTGKYGMSGGLFGDSVARAWMFQHGKSLFTDTGFGWEPADMQSFFELMVKYQGAKAVPSAAENAQDFSTALAQQMFGTGKVAMVLTWSNQIAAQQAAVGQDCKILRLPSMTGNAKDADLWYKSGQFQSITTKSKNQAAAAKFLDYYFNNADAGKVMLAERGLPPNTDVVASIKSLLGNADQKAATYMSDIAGEIHAAPVAPPPGAATFQTIMERYVENVQFGRQTPEAAAKALYDEAKAQIKS